MDKEYITRLIEGVREQAEKDYLEINGEQCVPAKWLDALLLCDVIEKELT
jgi:hypothetical protein